MNVEYLRALEVQSEWLRWSRTNGLTLWSKTQGFGNPAVEHLIYDKCLGVGECIYVSPQFCRFIDDALPGYPDETLFHRDLLPTTSGFVYFGDQMFVGKTSKEGWGTTSPNVPDVAGGVPMHISALGWITMSDQTVQFMTFITAIANRSFAWMPYSFIGIKEGDGLAERIARYEDNRQNDARYEDDDHHELRAFYVLLALMNQKLITLTREHPQRPTQRRALKAGVQEYDHVMVVEFRRRESKTKYIEVEEARNVDWKCRWIVRGHWRSQFYASTGRHAPVWVESYVKGPEGLPVKDDQRRLLAVVR